MNLSQIDPTQLPRLFVPLPLIATSQRSRSAFERLVTRRRRRLKPLTPIHPEVFRLPRHVVTVLMYLSDMIVWCTNTRPSQLRRSIEHTTLVVSGFAGLYYDRCLELLEAARKLDPLLTIDCKVFVGARAIAFIIKV